MGSQEHREYDSPMKRVTGIGGVFFKCRDKDAQKKWYASHLGIPETEYGHSFRWREEECASEIGYTAWSPFPDTTEYFQPSDKDLMINYRVDDLVSLLQALKEEGVQIIGEMAVEENGKFAWILDPEGNKIELWEPVPNAKDPYV